MPASSARSSGSGGAHLPVRGVEAVPAGDARPARRLDPVDLALLHRPRIDVHLAEAEEFVPHLGGQEGAGGGTASAAKRPRLSSTDVQHAVVGAALRVAARRCLALLVECAGQEDMVLDLADGNARRG